MTEVSINKQARLSEHLTSSSMAALGHSSELDGSHLTPHFTLAEMCKTSAKTPDGNIPSHVHIEMTPSSSTVAIEVRQLTRP